jgi:starch phosphorylase
MISFEEFSSHIESFDEKYRQDITPAQYFGFPIEPILAAESRLLSQAEKSVAYFSMEYGIAPSIYNTFLLSGTKSLKNQFYTHEVFSNNWLCDYLFKINIDKMLDIPIYSGGLGVLAGDTVKSIADHGFSVAAIGILWNKGYFKQKFWYKHGQIPDELAWDPHSYPGLVPLKNRVAIETKGGALHLRLWKYYMYSFDKKNVCPMILLDSNLPQNSDLFKRLTDQLYRSDDVSWKIYQRAILGIGGMKALSSLNYSINRYHLNEGHAAFALVEKYMSLTNKNEMEEQKKNFIYTCHTPVLAGHDRFTVKDISKIFDDPYVQAMTMLGHEKDNPELINLTYLCLNNCPRVNAVAQKHGEIMRLQFPEFASKIDAITNGVHSHTWMSESFRQLLERYRPQLGDWDKNPENLIRVKELKGNENFRREIFEAHQVNKKNLMGLLKNWQLRDDVFTISWARRIAGYKRPGLILHRVKRLVEIAEKLGPLQIILAGKAHPNDNIGGAHIEQILDHIDQLNEHKDLVKVLILENYDTYFGKLLTNSVDVWLNNPLPPFEASGTSGMKALLNGVVQLSTLDGWVVEAEHDNIGWIFGYRHYGPEIGSEADSRMDEDSEELYKMLEDVVSMYYGTYKDGQINPSSPWIDKMIHCIERGGFFNTHRMVREYSEKMWQ